MPGWRWLVHGSLRPAAASRTAAVAWSRRVPCWPGTVVWSPAGFAHLLQVLKADLRKTQYQPGLIDGCPAGTGLSIEPDSPDIMN
jgi:hypothetical protein